MKKSTREKINKIIISVFIILSSYVFVLNISRIYNLNKKTFIVITEKSYSEYTSERVKLKNNIEKIKKINSKYYTKEELDNIIDSLETSYDKADFKLNKTGKYKNILLYRYIEEIPSFPLSLTKYVLKTEETNYTYDTLTSIHYNSYYSSSLLGGDYNGISENYITSWDILCSTYKKYYSDLNEYADIVLQNEGGIK